MIAPVAIKKIEEIIRDKDAYIEDIAKRVKALITYVSTDQVTIDAIQALYLPKPMANLGMPSDKSGSDFAELYDLFEKRQVLAKSELRDLLVELLDEKELIERVWGCYMSLPHYPHDILEKYYEHHEILDAIAIDYQVAKQTIFRHKENALKMIAKRYASGIPLNTIFQMQKKHDKRIRESNNKIKVIFEMEKENKNE